MSTEQVPVNGFQVPPIPTQPQPPLNAGVAPPVDAQPGFVKPAELPALTKAGATNEELASAVEKLTAALAAQTKEAEPAAADPAPESYNALDPSTIEDPTLRSMATSFKLLGNGLDFDRIFSKAIDAGDPKLLDINYLREKGGANAEGLVGLAESIVNFTNQQAIAQQNAIFAMAGGEEQWRAATAAFNEKAPAEYKLAVKQLIDSRVKANIEAGAKLVTQFALGQGYVPTKAGLLSAGAGAPSGVGLDKATFQAELRKLNPNSADYATQRADLFARRTLGKQTGK